MTQERQPHFREKNTPIHDVKVRAVTPDDAPAIAAIYAPIVRDTTISFELEAPGENEMLERIVRTTVAYPWLVACRDDRVVGYAYASRHRERACYASSVDVSAYVDASFRGQNIGSALYGKLFESLRRLGTYHRAFAGIALPNDASVALHKKLGFQLVGVYHQVGHKFGRWIDVSWWERGIVEKDEL